MYLNEYNSVIFEEKDIFEALYQDNVESIKGLGFLPSHEIVQFHEVSKIPITFIESNNTDLYSDKERQLNWFMPEEYQTLNIRKWIIQQCNSPAEIIRCNEELVVFEKRNMIKLLQWLKYFVDSCYNRNVIIGVGRGSSVSSFVLYKIGVHKIDSLKHNLDYKEFLR